MNIWDLIPSAERLKDDSKHLKKFISIFDYAITELKDRLKDYFTKNPLNAKEENLGVMLTDLGLEDYDIPFVNKKNLTFYAKDLIRYKGTIQVVRYFAKEVLGYDLDIIINSIKLFDISNDLNCISYDPENSLMDDSVGGVNDIASYSYLDDYENTQIDITIKDYDDNEDKFNLLKYMINKYSIPAAYSIIKQPIVITYNYIQRLFDDSLSEIIVKNSLSGIHEVVTSVGDETREKPQEGRYYQSSLTDISYLIGVGSNSNYYNHRFKFKFKFSSVTSTKGVFGVIDAGGRRYELYPLTTTTWRVFYPTSASTVGYRTYDGITLTVGEVYDVDIKFNDVGLAPNLTINNILLNIASITSAVGMYTPNKIYVFTIGASIGASTYASDHGIGDIKIYNPEEEIIDFWKCDEQTGISCLNSIKGRSNLIIANPTLSTFHSIDNRFDSFPNNSGYSEGLYCSVSGTIYKESNFTIGTIEYGINVLSGTSVFSFNTLDNQPLWTSTGYVLLISVSSGFISLRRLDNDGITTNTLFQTLNGYVLEKTNYKIRIITTATTIAIDIKGDIYTDWTVIDPGLSGSNPVVDSTYRTSKYIKIENDTGDVFNNLEINNIPIYLHSFKDGTGVYKNLFIPRDESDITKDVLGNDLQHKGEVKYNCIISNTNIINFDGINDFGTFDTPILFEIGKSITIIANLYDIVDYGTILGGVEIFTSIRYDKITDNLSIGTGGDSAKFSYVAKDELINIKFKRISSVLYECFINNISLGTSETSLSNTFIIKTLGRRDNGASTIPFKGVMNFLEIESNTIPFRTYFQEGSGSIINNIINNINNINLSSTLSTFHIKDLTGMAIPGNILYGYSACIYCSYLGMIYKSSNISYGTWGIGFNFKSDDIFSYYFIATTNKTFPENNAYRMIINSRKITIDKIVGSDSTVLFIGEDDSIDIGVNYDVEINRSEIGIFTIYAKGGSFGTDFILIGAFFDNSIATSSNVIFEINHGGDYINRLYIEDAIINMHDFNGFEDGNFKKLYLPAVGEEVGSKKSDIKIEDGYDVLGYELTNKAGKYNNRSGDTITQYKSPKMIKQGEGYWFTDGEPNNIEYAEIVENENDANKIMTDVSIENQKKNIVSYSVAPTGDDLDKIKELLNIT